MNNDRFVTVAHYNRQMEKTEVEIVFEYESTTKMRFEKEVALREMRKKYHKKIRREIHGLHYRWLTCENPVRYCAINLEDNDDVQMMIAEHESIEIIYIELFADVCDALDPSRNVVGESCQMDLSSEFDMSGGNFVAMLASGTSTAFHPVGPSTYGSSYGSNVCRICSN
ncbi:hypothetical protein GQ457_04G012340 [Hibiscus cannabinus]